MLLKSYLFCLKCGNKISQVGTISSVISRAAGSRNNINIRTMLVNQTVFPCTKSLFVCCVFLFPCTKSLIVCCVFFAASRSCSRSCRAHQLYGKSFPSHKSKKFFCFSSTWRRCRLLNLEFFASWSRTEWTPLLFLSLSECFEIGNGSGKRCRVCASACCSRHSTNQTRA